MRLVYLGVVLLAASSATPSAVYRTRAQDPAQSGDLCADRYDSRRQHHCEVREEVISPSSALDIDPGHNGSVHVRGWQRSDLRLRTSVQGYAETEARAHELVSAVRVTAIDGRIRSDGVMTLGDEQWATSFYLDVPPKVSLAINTRNGGISLEEFSGPVVMRAVNGGITLRQVGGDIKGQTQNGAVRIELVGTRWDGTGLDVETKNGSIRLTLPANYSAELETGTVHGRVAIDFPVLIHSGRQRLFTTTLGSGGSKIRAMTTNGSVTVSMQ
jgi:putative adhesin